GTFRKVERSNGGISRGSFSRLPASTDMARLFTVLTLIWLGLYQTPLRFDFEEGGTDGWRETRLAERSNSFDVVEVEAGSALRATSERAASALLKSVEVELGEGATLRWRWKVRSSIAGNDRERYRDGDDYAARLFVVFDDDRLRRDTRAICYVWASHEPVGSTYENPFFESVATVVVESGDELAGGWVLEERDFVADYRQAFGEEPTTLGAVALMVDTDNTNSRAVAWFDDIVVRTSSAEPCTDCPARD
ncbi:MAG: DUF3047 domain-containing protein, partial [Rhodothermales bacterium]|nr:DUF3047 domain-containing protein [Rhodothermales bacterium]